MLSVFTRHGHNEAHATGKRAGDGGLFLPSMFILVSEHRHARKTWAHFSCGPCVSAFQHPLSRAAAPAAGPDTPPGSCPQIVCAASSQLPPSRWIASLCYTACRCSHEGWKSSLMGPLVPWMPACAIQSRVVLMFLLRGPVV